MGILQGKSIPKTVNFFLKMVTPILIINRIHVKDMQIIKYYINYKGGTNNRLVCRLINHRQETIKVFSGKTAEERVTRYLRKTREGLCKAYNTRGIDINPYAVDARKMPVRKLTSVHINLSLFGFGNFSASGNVEGMRKYYGKGALLVHHGDYIYNVTAAPDLYYNHSV